MIENPAQLASLVVLLGFALAFVFGAVVHKTGFCAMGAVSDLVNIGDWGRMRMWLLAIATAILGANALALSGYIDLSRSMYTGQSFTWLSYLLGGLLFGIGMTLASGCGSKNLVRLGGGNLKAFVVLLFLAVSAYMTMKGVFAVWRANGLDQIALHLPSGQGLPVLLADQLGASPRLAQWILIAAIAGGLLVFVFKDGDFRSNREGIFGGLVVGLVVVAGWYVTGRIGYLAEDPETLSEVFVATNSRRPESLTYVGPVAYSLELLLLWTDTSLKVTFGIATVAGALLGSFAYAILTGNFRWEGFASAADTRNHIIGGILMGFGGVTAMGCTIGQGITGLSTLALGSVLVFFAIVAGAALTMKVQYWRMLNKAD